MKKILIVLSALIFAALAPMLCASAEGEQSYVSGLALCRGEYEGDARNALKEYGEMVGADFGLVSFTDLNSGCGESSDYIFLGAAYSTDVRDAVCDIVILGDDHAEDGYVWENPFNGLEYQCVGGAAWTGEMWEPLASVDVNASTDGMPGYIFVSYDLRAGEPVTVMDVAFYSPCEYAALDEYGMMFDLNAGTYGDALYLYFSRRIYGETSWFNVTFDPMGLGSLEGLENVRRLPDELPEPEDRFGITFHGWYLDAGHTVPAEPGMEIYGDTTVYARNGYTVVFETYGGTELLPLTDVEVLPDELPEPSREGFRFEGWFIGDKEAGTHKLSGNELLTARWISEAEVWMKDFALAYSSFILRDAESLAAQYRKSSVLGAEHDALSAALALNGFTADGGKATSSESDPGFDRTTPIFRVMLKYADMSALELLNDYYESKYTGGDAERYINAIGEEIFARTHADEPEETEPAPDSGVEIGNEVWYVCAAIAVIFAALALYLNRRECLE